jgi:hypothetical protein
MSVIRVDQSTTGKAKGRPAGDLWRSRPHFEAGDGIRDRLKTCPTPEAGTGTLGAGKGGRVSACYTSARERRRLNARPSGIDMSSVELPVTFRASLFKTLLLLVTCLAFLAGSLALSDRAPLKAYGFATFWAIGSVVAAITLHPRAHYVSLTRDGFTYCTLFRKRHVAWREAADFRVVQLAGYKTVSWTYREDYAASMRERGCERALSGTRGYLSVYSLDSEQLAALMERVRQESADNGA